LETWAVQMGAKRLKMNASMMHKENHDRLCKLFERDMVKFETTYIKELC